MSTTDSINNGFDNVAFDAEEKPVSTKMDMEVANAKVLTNSLNNPNPENTSPYQYSERWRMLKNVLVISVAFMLNFTAFQSMANLQSSINPDSGLGTYSLSTLYAALVVSSMFLPTLLIRKLTCKWTLALSMLTYSVYISAQFYPTFYTLIPAAIILGFGAAPLWSAKCTYLTHIGNKYAELTNDDTEVIIVRFFGIFFMFFQSSNIWGNLISSTVLSAGITYDTTITADELKLCGADFCSYNMGTSDGNDTEQAKTPDSQIYILAGIYLACSLAAVLVVVVLVDNLIRYGEKERIGSSTNLEGKQLAVATFYHMKKPYQLLIIPLTIWSGMEQGYLGAEFTQGFVTCAYGIQNIGYVLICYGVCDATFSVLCSFILRFVGRIPIFFFAATLNVTMIFVMLFWIPSNKEAWVFYVMAGVWGIADAIWQTQINAFYGVLFPSDEEAAFSNYRLFESVGFIIAYAYSYSLCIWQKLYILLAVVAIGMTGYSAIEVLEYRRRKLVKKTMRNQ